MTHRARRSAMAAGIALVIVAAVGSVGVAQLAASGAPSSATYLLPWPAGEAHRQTVLQGVFESDTFGACTSGCSTHRGAGMHFAWDFDLPEGTPVLAARGGQVALVQGSWSPEHCGRLPDNAPAADSIADPLIGNQANFVLIDHGDGTSALYLHLSSVDPVIAVKARSHETVSQGEVLGRSGRTGLTDCRPHLHFQVQPTVRADWFTDSVPVHFTDRDVVSRSRGGVPVEGEIYMSDNAPDS